MATITTNEGSRAAGAADKGTKRAPFWTRVFDFLDDVGDIRARSAQVQALMALSDEQLAKRGLTRDTIVSHVFRDKMYL